MGSEMCIRDRASWGWYSFCDVLVWFLRHGILRIYDASNAHSCAFSRCVQIAFSRIQPHACRIPFHLMHHPRRSLSNAQMHVARSTAEPADAHSCAFCTQIECIRQNALKCTADALSTPSASREPGSDPSELHSLLHSNPNMPKSRQGSRVGR